MKIVTSLLLILNTLLMYAQQSPEKVNFPELGVAFTIPEGWTGRQEKDMIILGHQTISGLMVLFENTAQDTNELKNTALQGIHDAGVALMPEGDFNSTSTNRIEGFYKGTYQGIPVKAFAIGLVNEQGSGMSMIVLTESDTFTEAHRLEVNKVADSVIFFAPKDSENTARWRNKIQGRKLKYMHTQGGLDYGGDYSGTSDTVIINLCTNGQFTYYSNSHSSFDIAEGFGHANVRDDSQGSYIIYSERAQTFLELQYNSGTIRSYKLSTNKDRHTLLNGSRYFVTDIEGCE